VNLAEDQLWVPTTAGAIASLVLAFSIFVDDAEDDEGERKQTHEVNVSHKFKRSRIA